MCVSMCFLFPVYQVAGNLCQRTFFYSDTFFCLELCGQPLELLVLPSECYITGHSRTFFFLFLFKLFWFLNYHFRNLRAMTCNAIQSCKIFWQVISNDSCKLLLLVKSTSTGRSYCSSRFLTRFYEAMAIF